MREYYERDRSLALYNISPFIKLNKGSRNDTIFPLFYNSELFNVP